MGSGGLYIGKLRRRNVRDWEYKRNYKKRSMIERRRGKIKEMIKIME